jgi:hypothetical protein
MANRRAAKMALYLFCEFAALLRVAEQTGKS